MTAKAEILALASQYNISYHETAFDAFANKAAEISDNDVRLDDVQLLLLELSRQNVLSGAAAFQLMAQYTQEKNGG